MIRGLFYGSFQYHYIKFLSTELKLININILDSQVLGRAAGSVAVMSMSWPCRLFQWPKTYFNIQHLIH